MKRTVRVLWQLALFVGLASVGFAAPSKEPQTQGGGKDHRAAALVAALEADGFTVRPGVVGVTDILAAVNNHFIDSGAGANVGQYYKRWIVPPLPGQVTTPGFLFRLNPDEAVVYVGKTPPQGDYFSYCAFLWSRWFPDSLNPYTGDWLFSSVGDPLNNMWIKTEGQGNPFYKNTIVVLTADEGVYERIKQAAGVAGFPVSIVNPLVLPANALLLGTQSQHHDTFIVLMRTANIVSEAQQERYLNDLDWAKLYRVTPRTIVDPQPFAQPPWRERAWANEEQLVPGITAGLERLKAAILAKTPHLEARSFESIQAVPNSKEVLDPTSPGYRAKVVGESSDTPYLRTSENGEPANFIMGNDDVVVVYGVNHVASGIATYSSFAVYGEWQLYPLPPSNPPLFTYGVADPIWNGVIDMTSHAFAGSAELYIPRDPMARYLYAVRVVRSALANPRDSYSVVVPDQGVAAPLFPDAIPLDKPAMIGYRAYLNPATGAGPAYEDLVPDRAILFKVR
jgi:hypothetical protein